MWASAVNAEFCAARENKKAKLKLDVICALDTIINIRNNKWLTLFKTKVQWQCLIAKITIQLEF